MVGEDIHFTGFEGEPIFSYFQKAFDVDNFII